MMVKIWEDVNIIKPKSSSKFRCRVSKRDGKLLTLSFIGTKAAHDTQIVEATEGIASG